MNHENTEGCRSGICLWRCKAIHLCFILCFIAHILPVAIAADLPDYAPGVIIVKFRSNEESDIYAFRDRIGAYSTERAFPTAQTSHQLSAVYRLSISPDADIEQIARQYESDPVVEYIQPNYLNHVCSDSFYDLNDFFYEDQWALLAINAPEAWKIEKGSENVIIAIIDTGVDYNHEDLESRIWINPGEIEDNGIDDDGNGYVDDVRGWDFAHSPGLLSDKDQLDRDNDPMDENGHGTHVAGVAGAVPDNGTGIAGVTWNCRIMALRGGGSFLEDDDLSAAIIYAADNGAHIINMSWGSEHLSYIIRDAIEYAYNRGCVLLGAAGNDNSSAVIYPALHKHVISVGATNKRDKKAYFSNYGPGVDIVAPGEKVFGSTLNDKYSDWSGTSMATPVAAGVVALMLSKRPGLTNVEVAQILRSSADEIDEPLFAGVGRVNAAKALVMSSSLIAHITSPDSGAGADTELIIRGTAAGADFLSFQLEYNAIMDINSFTSLEDMEWISIDSSPSFPRSRRPDIDDLLGSWNVANLDEGTYIIRLKVFGHGGLEAEDMVIVNIDHSPPEITGLRAVRRLDGNRYRFGVTWRTNDPTFGQMYYRADKSDFQVTTSSSVTDRHTMYVSADGAPVDYEYFVTVTNSAGLIAVDDNNGDYYPLNVRMQQVPSDGFLEKATYIPAMHPITGTADFDGDGRLEIVGTAGVTWSYYRIKIYERNNAGKYDEVFETYPDYFPWAVGDTDGDGLFEILGNKKDVTFLYESESVGSYPTEKIWEAKGIWGGQIADMDQDGNKEIISRNLDTGGIYIYENRGDNSYLRVTRLQNPTEGDNYLATIFAISDFDGDGRTEIAIGDDDGDIFIYENTANDRYRHTWTHNFPDSEVVYIAAGDFDGDGEAEFVVECHDAGSRFMAKQIWSYTIFDRSGGDDEYEPVWTEEIMGIRKSYTGLSTGDIDNDGRDEIVILITPNVYIYKYYAPGICEALWSHPASKTRWPIIDDLDADGVNDLILNDEDKLVTFRVDAVTSASIRRPWGLSATPLGESEVELCWNGPEDAYLYSIYRGTDEKRLHMIIGGADALPASSTCFRDAGLESEMTYWYSVTSTNMLGLEGELSQKVSVTPNPPPKLLSAEYAPPIYLTFTDPMGQSAQNEALYIISSEAGFRESPSSAILDSNGKRVVITMNNLIQGIYTVTASGVRDATGVPISTVSNTATFHVPAPDVSEWSDLSHVRAYPNPVMPSSHHPGRIIFDNLPPDSSIRIYDRNGQLVRKLDEAESARGSMIWYLVNDQNRDVASGIYIYIIKSDSDKRVGKLAVVR